MMKMFLLLCSIVFNCISLALVDLDQARTQYPIVLVPGLFGFEELFGYAYFGKMPDLLRDNGATVYIARHSSVHQVEFRGEQLIKLLMEWGHEKYHLIGHSLGGIDARYVLLKAPELVASITTVSSPHRGSRVADLFNDALTSFPILSSILCVTGDAFAYAIGICSGNVQIQNISGAMNCLTENAMTEFNARNQLGTNDGDQSHLPLYSCGSFDVKPKGRFDVCGRFMQFIGNVFYGSKEKNDGLVSLDSMKFGNWIGEVRGAHHLFPSPGHFLSYSDRLINQFENLLLTHVQNLKLRGL